MKPIELGRMRIHKVHEMDSPVPLLSQLPGTTTDDMRRLLGWYDQPDEVNADPETSFMTFSVPSSIAAIARPLTTSPTCSTRQEVSPVAAPTCSDHLQPGS